MKRSNKKINWAPPLLYFAQCIKDALASDKNQKMVILVGIPGSGKSTYAKELEKQGYIRVNQDELGNRDNCVSKAKEAISEGKSVVIDRCNFDKNQRKTWINLAKYSNITEIEAVFFNIDSNVCLKRVVDRKDHPTIKEDMDVKKKTEIVSKFQKLLEIPSFEEGFTDIRTWYI